MTRHRYIIIPLLLSVCVAMGFFRVPLRLRDGSRTTVLSGAAARCTTKWMSVEEHPYEGMRWRQWVVPGTLDSSHVSTFFQWAGDTNFPCYFEDTVKLNVIGGLTDTTGAELTSGPWQYYPNICRYVRFIHEGDTDNSDSAYIGYQYYLATQESR